MNWITGGRSRANQQLDPVQKLGAYHELAKDAIERAYVADKQNARDRAVKLYAKGLEIIDEALRIEAPSLGLGPTADNVSLWRHNLASWQQSVQDRIRVLESGGASSSAPPSLLQQLNPYVALRQTQSVSMPLPQQQQQQQQQPARQTRSFVSASLPRNGAAQRAATAPAAGNRAGLRPYSTPPGTGSGAAGGAGKSRDGDAKYREMLLADVLDNSPPVRWDDIADLRVAKQALQEAVVLPALRRDIFRGLRAPVRGILLYGPPGNGKTLLGKALAHESRSTFFNISASSLTSKWVGEGEKLVRALFALAAERAPSIIFIDEIDSILTSRSSGEHEATRRLKTEFLVQFDGVASGDAHVVVVGATNRPAELDDAARRRFVKRIYIPLPGDEGRRVIVQHLMRDQAARMGNADVDKVVRATAGYSASDLAALCKEAAMGPVRELGARITSVQLDGIRPIKLQDFVQALQVIKPSVNRDQLQSFEDFTRDFGTK